MCELFRAGQPRVRGEILRNARRGELLWEQVRQLAGRLVVYTCRARDSSAIKERADQAVAHLSDEKSAAQEAVTHAGHTAVHWQHRAAASEAEVTQLRTQLQQSRARKFRAKLTAEYFWMQLERRGGGMAGVGTSVFLFVCIFLLLRSVENNIKETEGVCGGGGGVVEGFKNNRNLEEGISPMTQRGKARKTSTRKREETGKGMQALLVLQVSFRPIFFCCERGRGKGVRNTGTGPWNHGKREERYFDHNTAAQLSHRLPVHVTQRRRCCGGEARGGGVVGR